jgi:hypothetical protein
MTTDIQLLPAHQIDKSKWNNCIAKAGNGLIYADTRFLDAMSDNWSGIISNDYTAVMPLPWRKKWGIKYVYVPPFIQQLGLFGTFHDHELDAVSKLLQQHFVYGDIHFNFSNSSVPAFFSETKKRKNRVTHLLPSYTELAGSFSRDAQRNLQEANRHSLFFQEGGQEEAIQIFSQQMNYPGAPNRNDMERFNKLCEEFASTQQSISRSVLDKNNQLLAAIVGLTDGKRIYNLLNLTTPEGRKNSANYFLFDRLIQEWAGKRLLLDWEGSELPGVQSFYLHWGGEWEYYYHVHLNRLPPPLLWLKR